MEEDCAESEIGMRVDAGVLLGGEGREGDGLIVENTKLGVGVGHVVVEEGGWQIEDESEGTKDFEREVVAFLKDISNKQEESRMNVIHLVEVIHEGFESFHLLVAGTLVVSESAVLIRFLMVDDAIIPIFRSFRSVSLIYSWIIEAISHLRFNWPIEIHFALIYMVKRGNLSGKLREAYRREQLIDFLLCNSKISQIYPSIN